MNYQQLCKASVDRLTQRITWIEEELPRLEAEKTELEAERRLWAAQLVMDKVIGEEE